jgi:hypothetical protein
MNSKRAIGLTPKQLNLLDGYFWNEDYRADFVTWVNKTLGHGPTTGEEILKKLTLAADICSPLGAEPEAINEQP